MGRPELSSTIMDGMPKTQGGGYNSSTGNNHNGVADKIDQKIDSKSITLNSGDLNPNRAKLSNMNPGKDMGFWGKGNPQSDTTNHGKLTRSCKD